jgi:hypothetical protein
MPLLRDQLNKQVMTSFATFVSVEKTLGEVVGLCMHNERLKRLLFYTDKHALSLPRLSQEQSFSLLNEQIKIVPKLKVDPDTKPYIIVSLDNFTPAANQTQFRSITLAFDILCSYDHWLLDDFKLRPYAIAGEIDGMVNNTGVDSRVADFMGAKQLVLNEHLGGVSLFYNLETFFDDREKMVVDPERRGIDAATRLFDR